MKRTKKIALIMLAVALMAVCFIFGASALEPTGQCGDNVYWDFDSENGELVISGNGPMYDYEYHKGSSPFYDESDIKKVVIEENVTTIGDFAFTYCKEISDLTLGNSIISIGNHAFAFCDSIVNVDIPDSVTKIKELAFYNSKNLSSVKIGKEVSVIEWFVFDFCYSLAEFSVHKDNANYSTDENGVLFNKDKTMLIKFPSGSSIERYKIPDEVTTIGDYAFLICKKLTDVNITNKVTTIGDFAFCLCINLENIIMPDSITNFGEGAFTLCNNMTKFVVPHNVEVIGNMAVAEMPFLEEIIIEGMDVEIGENNCLSQYEATGISKDEFSELFIQHNLESVYNPEYEKHIIELDEPKPFGTIYCHSGSTAETYAIENGIDYELTHFFEGEWNYDYENNVRTRKCIHCDELETEELEVPEVGDTGTWGDYEYIVLEDGTVEITKYNGSDTELVIPEIIEGKSVTVIGERSFYGCDSLTKVKFPDSVTTIGDMAFGRCYNLLNVDIPVGVKVLDEYAFYSCVKLEKVTISESVTQIGKFAFMECYSLECITVSADNPAYSSDSEGVLFNKEKTILIQYPISNKSAKYTIPESVKIIEEGAFFIALYLEEIYIPENVETIGQIAFQQCFNLTKITISNGINSIGELAFVGAPFLEEVIVKDMDVDIGDYAICSTTYTISGISREEFIPLCMKCFRNEIPIEEVTKYFDTADELVYISKIYCHSGSTAEAYAIENGVKYELTHFFEGDWTYDYENNVRTRKCIHCDELETEELEIEEISGENFLLVEEKVVNGIEGNVEVLKAFDINLKNSEGVHVQPDGSIKVKLPNDWSKKGVYKVYRVNDDGTLTDMNAYREGSHLVFDTDHFSIYVIVFTPDETTEEEPETPDTPAEPDTSGCMCLCHKTDVFSELLMSIFRFLTKLLGVFPTCQCGVAHY